MLGLIGKKIGMTQAFDDAELLTPVTVLKVVPCPIVQIKDRDSDGYMALRIGYDETNRLNRADQGIFTKAGVNPHRGLAEFRIDDVSEYAVGEILDVGMFEAGEIVDVAARSKGRGFQGGVKRHGFRGGPKTHGQSDRHRAPGSIGQSSSPSRVFKGMRMAGHMGDQRVTVRGLKVVGVDTEQNLLLLKGAVPGSKGATVVIEKRN